MQNPLGILDWESVVTTLVTNLNGLFDGEASFNQDISSWDTSNVTNMTDTINQLLHFVIRNIGYWDVSNVTNFYKIFLGATAFNNNSTSTINNWDISSAKKVILEMFAGASNFNQPLGNWDVSNATDAVGLAGMFDRATSIFNQDIGYLGC